MELVMIIAIGELILKHGVPAALLILREWDVENPTLEDIEALKLRVPRPETFFRKTTPNEN